MSHRIVLDPSAVRPQLPPYQEIAQPAIRDAAAEWDAAKAALGERKREVVELEQTRPSAEWRDAEAAEAARAAGKPEPKRSHVLEHDKKTDVARHEEKIAVLAEKRAFDGLQAALDEQLGAWATKATGDVETLAKLWGAAVATLSELHGKLATAHRVRAIATGETGVFTSGIRIGPRNVQGLDFAPNPEGVAPVPGSQRRAPKGTVDLGHVLAELSEMGTLPELEAEPEPREMQTVNILGATRTIPKPLDRDERLQRAGARTAERESAREAVHAEIHGGE